MISEWEQLGWWADEWQVCNKPKAEKPRGYNGQEAEGQINVENNNIKVSINIFSCTFWSVASEKVDGDD